MHIQAGYGARQQHNPGPSCMHASQAGSRHELVLMPDHRFCKQSCARNPQRHFAMSVRRHALCTFPTAILHRCRITVGQSPQGSALLNVIVQAIRQGRVRQRRIVVNRHVHVQPSLRRPHVAGLQRRVPRRRIAGRHCARARALGGPRALLLLCTCTQTAGLPLHYGMSSII